VLFYAADDDAAGDLVAGLIQAAGFDPALSGLVVAVPVRLRGGHLIQVTRSTCRHSTTAPTVLTGLLDRSALHGALAEIGALDLDLLQARQLATQITEIG
jgi:hypothetical protein